MAGEFRKVVKQSDGPIGEGTVFCYTIDPGERSATMRFVEWEPGRRLAWDGPPLEWHGGAGEPRGYFEVTDAGEGHTRLVCCFQPILTGSMALLAPVMKRAGCASNERPTPRSSRRYWRVSQASMSRRRMISSRREWMPSFA